MFFYLNTSQRKTTEQTKITKNDIFLWIWERSFLSESWPWPYDRKAVCGHPWRRVINVALKQLYNWRFFLGLVVYFVVIRWFGLLRNNAGRSAFTFIWKVTKLCRVEVVSLTVETSYSCFLLVACRPLTFLQAVSRRGKSFLDYVDFLKAQKIAISMAIQSAFWCCLAFSSFFFFFFFARVCSLSSDFTWTLPEDVPKLPLFMFFYNQYRAFLVTSLASHQLF